MLLFLANAGTTLIWVSMLHMTVGNAVIGLIEGLCVARFFSAPKRKAILLMIGANYLSASAGIGLAFLPTLGNCTVENGRLWFWALVPLSFFITVLLEWPFTRWILGAGNGALRASLRIHFVSYPLLFLWFWSVSSTGFLTTTEVVSAEEFDLPSGIDIFYLDEAGKVQRRALQAGSRPAEFKSPEEPNTELNAFWRSEGTWDLVLHNRGFNARNYYEEESGNTLSVLRGNLPHQAGSDPSSRRKDSDWPILLYWGPYVNQLGNPPTDEWEIMGSSWPGNGIRLRHKKESRWKKVAGFETPLGYFNMSNITELSNGLVLCQVNRNQICIADPHTDRIALLWLGRDPVPVFREGFDSTPVRASPENPSGS